MPDHVTRSRSTSFTRSGSYWPLLKLTHGRNNHAFCSITKEKIHRYTPDLLVVWGARQELVEIKADAEADLPENQARFTLIRALLNEHGYHFRLWKKSQICAEPRLANAG